MKGWLQVKQEFMEKHNMVDSYCVDGEEEVKL
jgi:hypothetical protein